MINNFENTKIVLTSQNPETFINFEYESGDPSVWYIQPDRNYDISSGLLYINGFDINDIDTSVFGEPSIGYSLIVDFDGDPSIAAFHVYSPFPEAFDAQITFNVYGNTSTDASGFITLDPDIFATYDVSIWNRPHISEIINPYNTSNSLIDDESSYGLLRTNPKFTGNVKLIVDPSHNLFLDTFKVSDPLSHKKYRHQRISSKSVLSNDIRRVFETLPIGEMYKVGKNDTLDIAIPKTEYKNQYETDYISGSRIFKDELYEEKYSIFAPLWINNKLPDYFAIFKLDTIYNKETYDSSLGLENLANEYITNGTIIQSYSFKKTNPLGEYMISHLKEADQFRSPVFLSLSDPAQSDSDPNIWHGIAIDKGIITGRAEIPFFFDKTTNNFTKTNAFISEGFERNNLLCSNLVNFEYIFNDPDLPEFKMARYFGLYLTDNPIYKIAYYADSSMGSIDIISLDGKDSTPFFDSAIFGFSRGDIVDKYADRIFALTHEFGIKRFDNAKQITGFNRNDISEFLNKPDKNIISTKAELKQVNPYISLHINEILQQGEHLRIVNKTKNIIWEIYGIDSNILGPENAWTYVSTQEPSIGFPRIYRNAFSVQGDTINQAHSIKNAFDAFQNHDLVPFVSTVVSTRNHIVSLILDDTATNSGDIYQFQRITSQTRDIPHDNTTNFNSASKPGDISYFDYFTPIESDFEIVLFDSIYGPIDFELHGDRKSLTLDFLDTSDYNLYSLNKINKPLFNDLTLYLSSEDNWYKRIDGIDISSKKILTNTIINKNNHRFIYDPIINGSNYMFILTKDLVSLIKSIFNGYSIYPVNISLMGINDIKDLDFTVYDSSTYDFKSEYWYDRSDDASTYSLTKYNDSSWPELYPNSYQIIGGTGTIYIGTDSSNYSEIINPFYFNTFNDDVSTNLLVADTSTTIIFNKLDGSKNYKSYIYGKSEEDINDYYVDASTKKQLKYSLTIPQISKWNLLGKDVRGNDLRILLDSSIIDASSNFIPYKDDFLDEISYPTFKYIGLGNRAWENYIYIDINDSIEYIDTSINKTTTVKKYMFDNPNIDVFSKIVYANKLANKSISRSSISYFNKFKNDLNIIISGLNLSMSVVDEAKNVFDEKDWDKYKVSLISTPSRNNTTNEPFEVIINENFGTILMIWYQGSDDLNYNRKYSTYFSGKNFIDVSTNVDNFSPIQSGTSTEILNRSNIKTPFLFRSDTNAGTTTNTYGTSSVGYNTNISSSFAQLNWNWGQFNYTLFNAYGGNEVNGINILLFSVSWNTFLQAVDYSYFKNENTFSDNSYNWAYQYNTNTNNYIDNTTHLDTLSYILEPDRNNVRYYVIRGEDILSHGLFNNKPIKIQINKPRFYTPSDSSTGVYTYNGWIKPSFKKILNFNSNEEKEIIDIFEQDFILSNTSLASYNYINQYWYNKVTQQVDSTDLLNANAIHYNKDFNPFKSLWDAEYFTLDSSVIDGTSTTEEAPSFFGSKVVNLPRILKITTWYNNAIQVNTDDIDHTFKFNISRAIISLFKNNLVFVDNWLGLGDSASESIDGYIRDTVINYYNITIRKVSLDIFSKPYDGTRIALINDDSFNIGSNNIEGSLEFINGDYIYTINTLLIPDLSYYISIKLIEK